MKKCKIRLTDDSKKFMSMLEIDDVKAMIQELQNRGLETDIFKLIPVAMGCIKSLYLPTSSSRIHQRSNSTWSYSYYDVTMEICENRRVPYNYYTENSAFYDVWVDFKAFNDLDSFYVVGIYLSDIYSISEDNKQNVRTHMYVKEYNRKFLRRRN